MKPAKATLLTLFGMSIVTLSFPTYSAQVINDNLMIKGRECVGTDCLSNETMVHDAIRVKSNTQRIHFEDTSVGSYPGNNWRLLINDLNEFGTNYFGIEDSTAGRVPFRIDAGAPNAALRIGSTGRIGMGTSLPQRNLHIVSNNPALRLESVNLTFPSFWDIDVGISFLGFKNSQGTIFALSNHAPQHSFKMDGDGDVGVGTIVPHSSLHIFRNDGSAQIQVENSNGSVADRTMLLLSNDGNPGIQFLNQTRNHSWKIQTSSNDNLGFYDNSSTLPMLSISEHGHRLFLHNSFDDAGWNLINTSNSLGFSPSTSGVESPTPPMKVMANGSLYVRENIGVGTETPTKSIHVVTDTNPAIRMETPNSIWDVSGNNIWFFIADRKNNTSPFKLYANAPSDSLTVVFNGKIGMGTGAPASSLHIRRSDGSAQLLVEDIENSVIPRTLLKLKSNGETRLSLDNTSSGVAWDMGNTGSGLAFSVQGSGSEQMVLSNNGNLAIAGTLTVVSDINQKTAIETIHTADILDKLNRLTINRWEYKDARGEKHIGPMAQDFYALFGLGGDEKGISTLDAAGVTIAAVQALTTENTSLKAAYRGLLSAHWELRQTLEEMQAALQAQHENTQRVETLVNQLYRERKGGPLITALK